MTTRFSDRSRYQSATGPLDERPAWRITFDREVKRRRSAQPLPQAEATMTQQQLEAVETLRCAREHLSLEALMRFLYGMIRGGVISNQAELDAFCSALRGEFLASDIEKFFEKLAERSQEAWEFQEGYSVEPADLDRARKLLLS